MIRLWLVALSLLSPIAVGCGGSGNGAASPDSTEGYEPVTTTEFEATTTAEAETTTTEPERTTTTERQTTTTRELETTTTEADAPVVEGYVPAALVGWWNGGPGDSSDFNYHFYPDGTYEFWGRLTEAVPGLSSWDSTMASIDEYGVAVFDEAAAQVTFYPSQTYFVDAEGNEQRGARDPVVLEWWVDTAVLEVLHLADGGYDSSYVRG